jgi:catechol 2,3-dioxygenase-like lactoylglutathione lyase family enzyme
VTRSSMRAIPEGLHTITPHIVVRDAAQAAEWYKQAFGAHERSRVPLPGGKLMSVELWFGDPYHHSHHDQVGGHLHHPAPGPAPARRLHDLRRAGSSWLHRPGSTMDRAVAGGIIRYG